MRFIPPSEIAAKVMTLLDRAKIEMIIVSPYNRLAEWEKMRRCLRRAVRREVRIQYYVRDDERQVEEVRTLGIEPIPVPNLHAKVYLNETSGVVTSMNLTQSSDIRSVEIGYETETSDELEELRAFVRDHVVRNAPQRAPRPAPRIDPPRQSRERPQIWQDLTDWALVREFERALVSRLLHGSHRAAQGPPPERASDMTLRDSLYLSVFFRRSYLQLAFSFGTNRKGSLPMYEIMSAQGEAIENELNLGTHWGPKQRRMFVRLESYPAENVASWPGNSVDGAAQVVERCAEVLGRRIDAARQLLGS